MLQISHPLNCRAQANNSFEFGLYIILQLRQCVTPILYMPVNSNDTVTASPELKLHTSQRGAQDSRAFVVLEAHSTASRRNVERLDCWMTHRLAEAVSEIL